MRIERVEISNFFSFDKNIEVDFMSNFALVKGKRKVAKDSNGSGKSSLFEAIYWCFSGVTVRKVRASDVIRKGCTECVVSVIFTLNGRLYDVKRVYSSKTKRVVITDLTDENSKPEEFHDSKQATARVFEILKITPEQLSLSCFCGNRFSKFSNYTPREKAALIDCLADSDRWESMRLRAVKDSKEQEQQFKLAESQQKRSSDDLFCISEEEKALYARFDQYGSSIEDNKSKLSKELKELEGHVAELHGLLPEKPGDLSGKLNALISKQLEARKEVEAASTREVDSVLATIVRKLDILASKKSKAELDAGVAEQELSTKKCYSCGQSLLTVEGLDEKLAALREEVVKVKNSIAELEGKRKSLQENKDKLEYAAEKATTVVETFDKEVAELNREIEDSSKTWRDVQAMLDTEKKLYEAKKLEVAVFDAKVEEAYAGLDRELEALAERKKKAEEIRKQHIAELRKIKEAKRSIEFWVQGFKDIRFSLFDGIAKSLEDLLTHFCRAQGLDFDKITVGTWKQLVSGKTVPEVTILLKRGKHELGVEALSDGERQRIDIASFVAMAMIVEEAAGHKLDLKVFDEPLAGIDEAGKQNIFDVLLGLSEEGRQVFSIDHDANFQDRFDEVLVANRSGESTRIDKLTVSVN